MFEAKFQTFEDQNDRAAVAARVAALRTELKKRGLDGFVVPRSDRQQNEYVPASEERLAWLTGFSGSAGAAVVTARRQERRAGQDRRTHAGEAEESPPVGSSEPGFARPER